MNSPEETQLADDLRHIAQGPSFAPDLDAIERRGRRAQQRALALRGLAATGVVGVAVAGTLVAFRHPGTTGSTGGAPVAGATAATKTATGKKTTTTAPRIENLAYVRQQVEAAPYPPDSVVAAKQTQSGSGGYTTLIWTDPATGNMYQQNGSGAAKTGNWEHDYFDSKRVLHWDQTEVDYGPRTWWNFNEHAAGPISGPVPKGPISGDYTSATWVKEVLARDYGKITGHPVVDGHPTVEISASYLGMKWLFYVDSKTFLVVRQVKFFPSPLRATLTDDYTWVKRTPALKELINNPQIPAGYTQVAPPN
jgi:hypothetical protein